MTGASVWSKETSISGNSKSAHESFSATDGQQIFTITAFTYAKGTGALNVYKNGLRLIRDTAWAELTTSTFWIEDTEEGDKIEAVAHVGMEGEVNTTTTDNGDMEVSTLKGDIVVFDGESYQRQAVSSTDGDVLQSDSTADYGVSYTSRLTTAETEIDTLQASLETAEEDIETLQDDLDTAETTADELADTVTALTARIVQNESDIDTNEEDIDDLDTRITSLEGDDTDDTDESSDTSTSTGSVHVTKTITASSTGTLAVLSIAYNSDTTRYLNIPAFEATLSDSVSDSESSDAEADITVSYSTDNSTWTSYFSQSETDTSEVEEVVMIPSKTITIAAADASSLLYLKVSGTNYTLTACSLLITLYEASTTLS